MTSYDRPAIHWQSQHLGRQSGHTKRSLNQRPFELTRPYNSLTAVGQPDVQHFQFRVRSVIFTDSDSGTGPGRQSCSASKYFSGGRRLLRSSTADWTMNWRSFWSASIVRRRGRLLKMTSVRWSGQRLAPTERGRAVCLSQRVAPPAGDGSASIRTAHLDGCCCSRLCLSADC